ncbi:MFS transporter [Nocardiopsis akebiae]|uniref:MFS transporter n=1 Tax=Nocardiopsis akebiae TaxID=2831968 RepID=A0ABX8BWU7_9ACTN|nr:MFS transporter [Nocardiopsis akebiae]QUX26685.1 MFS transporter [Nocardiopsis akebiae]
MTTLSSRAPGTRPSRLTRPLYAYAALGEFVLLYPLYALLFDETGLTVAQISSLFVIWSLSSVLASVPAGAWADVVPRRYLLAAAPLLAACAFVLWLLWPGYWTFALGFVLWGAGGALSSGSLEALVYTELARRGASDRYARVMGVTRALDVAAVGAATLLAIPVMAHGGYAAVGAASVAACVLCALAALALPEHRAAAGGSAGAAEAEEAPSGYLDALRGGLAEARSSRRVRGAILLVVAVTAFWEALDEYVPLLVAESGVPAATVPVAVLVVWAFVLLGGLLAGPASRLPVRALAVLVGLTAPAIAAGALLDGPVGWVLIGAGFGLCQTAGVVADARLQDRITGPTRATVTSLAGLGTDALTTASYLLYAGVFAVTGHALAFALFALPYLVAALVLGRVTRGARPARRSPDRKGAARR